VFRDSLVDVGSYICDKGALYHLRLAYQSIQSGAHPMGAVFATYC